MGSKVLKKLGNKDLSVLSRLAGGAKFYKVHLQGKDMESFVTNPAGLASIIKEAECETSQEVEEELQKDVRGSKWEKDKKGFEQHMLEEDVVRMGWAAGRFEKESMRCESCGVKKRLGQSAPVL